MDERILKWLFDVKIAIAEIESYFENSEMDFFKYRENLMLKRAVERDLEIIGEAINRIITKDSNFESKITNAKSIIGLRNQVIHAYDNISDENALNNVFRIFQTLVYTELTCKQGARLVESCYQSGIMRVINHTSASCFRILRSSNLLFQVFQLGLLFRT